MLNKNSIKIKQSNILKKNLKNILDEFKKLDFNNEKQVNEFLENIIEKFNYIKPILLKEIKSKKKGGTCKKCNIFKGGASNADRSIMNQQQGVCFLCLEGSITNNRRQTNELFQDRGILKHHEEPGNCQIVAHENCWRDLFQNMDAFRCPGCHKILEMQDNEVVINNAPMLNNNDDDNFAAQLNVFIDNNREVDNNDMIYNSLFVALFITFIKLFKMSNNPFIYFILFFCYRFLLKMLNRNYRRNPNPPLGIIALGYMVIPFFVLILATLTIESISILGGPHLVYDTYDNIKNIIEIIHEKIISDEINNPDFNQLRNQVLYYNNNTNLLDIEGGYKKSKKNKRKINKTKKRIRKQKGSGNVFSTFRRTNSSVQPERNYTYGHYNNSTILPDESVPIREYTSFRCTWKNNIRRDFQDDYDGIFVDNYLDIIINPIDENEHDWIFAGVTDESIKGEIGEYIRHYRNLLLRSYTNENVFDFYSEQSLSSYDIHKKMYELLKIKKYILDHPIQQAQAEIVRPAEPASIANGGKKKKNKTKKLR